MRLIESLNKALIFAIILAMSAARGEGAVKWSPDGAVSVDGKSLRVELQSVTTGMADEEGIYLGGYKITGEGENLPYVAFVPISLREARYWPLGSSVREFFRFDGKVHVLGTDGMALVRDSEGWQPTVLRFKPDSVVVSVEPKLIACNPAPLMKASQVRGSCYALDQSWETEINWRTLRPKICGDVLLAIEQRKGHSLALKVDPATGKVLDTKRIVGPVENACRVNFDE